MKRLTTWNFYTALEMALLLAYEEHSMLSHVYSYIIIIIINIYIYDIYIYSCDSMKQLAFRLLKRRPYQTYCAIIVRRTKEPI